MEEKEKIRQMKKMRHREYLAALMIVLAGGFAMGMVLSLVFMVQNGNRFTASQVEVSALQGQVTKLNTENTALRGKIDELQEAVVDLEGQRVFKQAMGQLSLLLFGEGPLCL